MIFLQLSVILVTASIISLLAVKIYPSRIFKHTPPNPSPIVKSTLAPNQTVASAKVEVHPPTQINIPAINLKLPVAPGIIENNQWTLYDDRISWLSTSELPSQGNVILYGHNRIKLFANLKNLKIGDLINIEDGKQTYTYKVTAKHQVSPTDIDVIISTDDQLTLYTCDGTFDQKRLVVIASRQS